MNLLPVGKTVLNRSTLMFPSYRNTFLCSKNTYEIAEMAIFLVWKYLRNHRNGHICGLEMNFVHVYTFLLAPHLNLG